MATTGDPDSPRGETLLALKLGGRLSASEVETRTGLAPERVAQTLRALQAEKLVEAGPAPDGRPRYRLSPSGDAASAALLEADRVEIGAALGALLEAFARDNTRFKDLVRRWQVRLLGGAEVPNDHSDPEYDDRLLRELGGLLRDAESWLARLPTHRPRYARYRSRMAVALDRAGRGDLDYVCGLSVDSVHSIWWQLHADLLAVLGRDRSEADA